MKKLPFAPQDLADKINQTKATAEITTAKHDNFIITITMPDGSYRIAYTDDMTDCQIVYYDYTHGGEFLSMTRIRLPRQYFTIKTIANRLTR